MTAHYLDLRVLPDPELATPTLLSVLYGRLHAELARARSQTLAVVFPGYDGQARTLGDRLRIIGTLEDLETLMAQPWLGGLRDQLHIGEPTPVPATAVSRSLRRVQAKSSPGRLRRRQMRRHGLSAAEAALRVPDGIGERLDLPWLAMQSKSTGQAFRLYLRLGPMQPYATGARHAYRRPAH